MTDQTNKPGKGDSETPSTSAPSAGHSQMIGEFRVIREIGSGGMGVVYEAEQQHPKRLVALEVIRGGRLVDDQQVKLFEREAQALARLKHPAIAAIYESGRTSEGQHFFAMELVRGETLTAYLEKASSSGPLTSLQLRERLAIFRKIADAVTYALQRGAIHRDLKPANIIVSREFEASESGSGPQTPGIKILDFGSFAALCGINIDNTQDLRSEPSLSFLEPQQPGDALYGSKKLCCSGEITSGSSFDRPQSSWRIQGRGYNPV